MSTAIGIIAMLAACATRQNNFDGDRALRDVIAQMELGARPAGSAANRATGDYILAQLAAAKRKTKTQEFIFRGVPIRNVIGILGEGKGARVIIGAHYDTRLRADQDRDHPDAPVPGANDGASGVAVLLELARTVDESKLKNEVWLAFFDAEDNGGIDGCLIAKVETCEHTAWNWSVGAAYVAEHLEASPFAVIVLDMIGDADQNIFWEYNSDKELQTQLWAIAARLGYTREFIPQFKWSMEDDHTPFLRRGLRAVDVIDFDYPYWHTTQDTADKISAASLERVGRVMQVWLEGK
ncbi:MAG: M28 family peptidase [Chloroflexi bacterium]|nr:M28 family peptidase [Chloroflexota bacterium]